MLQNVSELRLVRGFEENQGKQWEDYWMCQLVCDGPIIVMILKMNLVGKIS